MMLLVGCKTAEQKLLDETLAFNEEAYGVLSDHAGDADKAVKALVSMEEATRDRRRQLKADFKTALEQLDEKEKEAFLSGSKKHWEEFASKFETVIKRYPPERQQRLRDLVGQITH